MSTFLRAAYRITCTSIISMTNTLSCRYIHVDMQDLEETLKETADARIRLIVTDGRFFCRDSAGCLMLKSMQQL